MSILGWGECAHFIVDVDCRVGGEVGCVGSVLLLPPTWQTKKSILCFTTPPKLCIFGMSCVSTPWTLGQRGHACGVEGARVELWKTFCHLYRIMRHRSAIFASDMLIRNL